MISNMWIVSKPDEVVHPVHVWEVSTRGRHSWHRVGIFHIFLDLCPTVAEGCCFVGAINVDVSKPDKVLMWENFGVEEVHGALILGLSLTNVCCISGNEQWAVL